MSKTTRGDALADAVERYLHTWEAPIEKSEDGGIDQAFACAVARNNLRTWLNHYRASEPKGGERVRAAWTVSPDGKWCVCGASGQDDEDSRATAMDCNPDMDSDGTDFHWGYVEFTIPPRAEPVVVEGEVDG